MGTNTAARTARLVTEIDLPEIPHMMPNQPDRLAVLAAARDRHWLARMPGGYAVLRYEDVVAIHRDRRFVNGGNVALRRAGIKDERFLARRPNPFLRTEGDDHTRLRRLVAPSFTPKSADKLRPFMRRALGETLDRVAPTGRAELVHDFFDPFPIAVICELLGAPPEDWQLFFDWTRDIFQIYGGDIDANMDRILEAHRELDDYTEQMIEQRREQPRDDLLTALIAAEETGDRLSTQEMQSIVEAVLLAGTDTTRSQLGITVGTILEHPDQMQLLLEDPGLIPNAVEESLRFLSSVGGQPRYVHEDTEYRDVIFPAGTMIQTHFVSANFDPSIWGEDADCFDVKRRHDKVPQLTFGIGRHLCLGHAIARAELQEAVHLFLQRMPGIRVDGEITWAAPGKGGMWGAERLPVLFEPGH